MCARGMKNVILSDRMLVQWKLTNVRSLMKTNGIDAVDVSLRDFLSWQRRRSSMRSGRKSLLSDHKLNAKRSIICDPRSWKMKTARRLAGLLRGFRAGHLDG
jgi:hypothetical protein